MRKRKRNSFGKIFIKIFMIGAFIAAFPILKIVVLDFGQSIKPVIMEKIVLTSLLFGKPKESVNYYMENYIREDREYEIIEAEISSEPQPEYQPEQSSESVSKKEPIPKDEPKITASSEEKKEIITPPFIDPKYRGTIQEQVYTGGDNKSFVKKDGVYVRNYTGLSAEKLQSILDKEIGLKLKNTDEPQVLIYHTHATESFEEYDNIYYDTRGSWRSTDNNKNMIAVGEVLRKELEKQGIGVIHDFTQHDYPSYSGSYKRSAETVERYLKKYPSIKIVLDVHRDAVEKPDNVIVKSRATVEGEKAAQVMVVCACDEEYKDLPNWEENFKLGVEITKQLEKDYKGITRPLYLSNANYNMNLSKGLLIMEFGTNANTLEEAKITAKAVGKSLPKLLKNYMEG